MVINYMMKKKNNYFCMLSSLIIAFIFPFLSFSQTPDAEFTAVPLKGCSPLVVSFTDLSTNTPTSWTWNFGDGGANSTVQNPSRVYVTPGVYTVLLTATNANGSNTETKTAYITVFANPVANFSSNTTVGCDAVSVNFSDLSTEGDTTIISWQWDFGDGSNSTLQNPTHNYVSSGNFTVTLQVTDANGCFHAIPKTNYIIVNTTPIAGFSGTPLAACNPPLTVNFTNTSTGTGALTYQWAFGDANTSTLQNPSNNYTIAGNFNVTLIAKDAIGCADTLTFNNYVNIQDLNTSFSASPVKGCAPLTVQFTDASTSNPNLWSWNFGDAATSAAQSPSHSYAAAGTYTVKLVSGNAVGCTDSLTISNMITVSSAPTSNFIADTTSNCAAPFTIQFTDLSVPNSGTIISWLWNFGDAATSAIQNPSHTYTSTGSFTVTLTVMNSDSCINTFIRSNYINIIPPNASFVSDKTKGCIPLSVNFTDFSTPSLTDVITSWDWKFGDANTSAIQNPSNTYVTDGDFIVTLIITTLFGCKDTATGLVEAGTKPTADFAVLPDSICFSTTVQFTDLSSALVDEWMWTFGDGNSSGVKNPVYNFQGVGKFYIQLIAGYNGCYDTSRIDSIVVSPPIAGFTAVPRIGCFDSVIVAFNDTSFGANKWYWSFGDGKVDSAENPSHTYTTAGFFDVTLISIDTLSGCADTLLDTSYVVLDSLVVNFAATPDSGCRQLAVTFSDSSSALSNITSWKWFFGDGDSSAIKNPAHTYQDTGLFNVTLIIADQLGCIDTLLKPSFIDVRGLYTKFNADTTFGCTPLIVSFKDSTGGTSSVIQWIWNYGDSKIDTFLTKTNPIHTYLLPGIYTVNVSVRDTVDKCLMNSSVTIIPTYPFPTYTSNDVTPCQNEVITFNASGTSAAVPTYFWDFGDTNKDTTASNSTTHTYLLDGTYTITLTVVDSNGCDSTVILSNYITVNDPVAGFTANKTSDCYPLFVNFTDTSSGNISAWSWNFGDATPLSADSFPSHAFNYPNSYDIRLIITDNKGCIDTSFKPGYIEALGPVGSFVFNNDSGCVPYPVTFTPTSINTDSYTWDFRDGTVITIPDSIYTHAYDSGGIFQPILILNDTITPTKICKIIATPPNPNSIYVDNLIPSFLPSDTTLCNPGIVNFRDQTSTLFTLIGWKWRFGDGDSSTLQNSSNSYTDTGKYAVVLQVANSLGCLLNDTNYVRVYSPPTLQFTSSDYDICVPDSITITDNSLVSSKITSWLWNFGDGGTSTSSIPVHEYITSGNYSVSMTVTYGDTFCLTSFTSPNLINAYDPPLADFSIEDTIKGQEFLTVNFKDESVVNNVIGTHFYSWNFGDVINNSSTEINPTHIYIKAGDFKVREIVTNAGCSDTAYKTITVRNTEKFDIPNIFTPHPITPGVNDKFFINGLKPNSKLLIYNRWGQLIYENPDYQNNWDGGIQPADVYYYVLIHEQADSHGFVRIIR